MGEDWLLLLNRTCCRFLTTDVYSSFELQLFVLELDNPMAISVIYCPPKPHKDFINEFSDFLGSNIPNFDRLLILGDFDIHMCCPANILAKEFLSLIDSFDLIQLVNVPTHVHGHTLDLVLSHGLSVCDVAIDDHIISDHKITFRVPISFSITRPTKAVRWSHMITPTTCSEFLAAFKEVSQSSDLLCDNWSGVDYLNHFNIIYANILNSLTPIKAKQHKPKSEPWLNDGTRALQQVCRRAERRWKKRHAASLI